MEASSITQLLKNPSKSDVDLITKAFEFAQEAHSNQKRFSGEPYITHPFEVAKTLAHLQLDSRTIAAALLHDTCEDNPEVTDRILRKKFGDEIAFLVDGVTKIGKLKYLGVEREVENLRKLFLAMATDIRVVLIRLADRLHNMKTLSFVPPAKQKRIALETLEIYAPLANRLGIGEFKGQLEDLSFPYIYPEEYKKVKSLLTEESDHKEKALLDFKNELEKELRENGVTDFLLSSRFKHLYSLFKKLNRTEINMNLDQVYDLIALRVIVKNVEDCYRVLGIIHKKWTPLPDRIKDYIAVPKLSGYQSLHTTIFISKGDIAEVQIRTEQMHKEAEHGIAAHWAYSESGKPKEGAKVNPRLAWVNQLIEWQKNTTKPQDFIETLKIDFFKDRVFCFTPRGDVIDLPEDATAVDFAYAVHSDIGNGAVGAKVNHKFVALDTILKNGDIVEIVTQKNKKPSQEWARFAKTSFAKKQIKKSAQEPK